MINGLKLNLTRVYILCILKKLINEKSERDQKNVSKAQESVGDRRDNITSNEEIGFF